VVPYLVLLTTYAVETGAAAVCLHQEPRRARREPASMMMRAGSMEAAKMARERERRRRGTRRGRRRA
jgi:hypothetical protein